MEYKLLPRLSTEKVEIYAERIREQKALEKYPPAREMSVIRAAIDAKWFDGPAPSLDVIKEWEPVETMKLGKQVIDAYNHACGFDDLPSLLARLQITPKPLPEEKK